MRKYELMTIFPLEEEKSKAGLETGETIKIAASKTPKFKPGKALKDRLNKK